MPYREVKIPEGVVVCKLSEHHWQIKGKILINHYPLSKSRTAYLQNTTRGISGVSAQQAIKWAKNPASIPMGNIPLILKRKRSYKSVKKQLVRKGITHCFWCKKKLGTDITIEHIVPLSRGGLDCEQNWTLAHESCNKNHGNKIEVTK